LYAVFAGDAVSFGSNGIVTAPFTMLKVFDCISTRTPSAATNGTVGVRVIVPLVIAAPPGA
jgi:hypothetical protein